MAGETIVANGLQAASLAGLPDGLQLPLRPVYGDILRLAFPGICARWLPPPSAAWSTGCRSTSFRGRTAPW